MQLAFVISVMQYPRVRLIPLFFSLAAYGQAPDERPAFEVASIRRCEKGEQGGVASPGYLEPGCQTLFDVIR